MLSDSNHSPALRLKGFTDQAISSLICRKLPLPELGVGCRLAGMVGTAMPKATVHENRQPCRAKHKIRFSEQGRVPPPAGDAVGAEQQDHPEFRRLVSAAADAGHHRTTLLRREDINHGVARRGQRRFRGVARIPPE